MCKPERDIRHILETELGQKSKLTGVKVKAADELYMQAYQAY